MKILVVDDSLTMRRIIVNILTQIEIDENNIYQAADGKDAIRVLEETTEKMDLILTDWNMPKMNGLDFVKFLRNSYYYKKVPIIMITTEGGKPEVIKALKAGVNNYIVKPFNASILRDKIKDFI